MAFTPVVPRQNRGSGTYRGNSITPPNRSLCRVRLLATRAIWESNAIVTFGWEVSYNNGDTWQHYVSGNPPFSFDKQGNPPSIGIRGDNEAQYRPFIVTRSSANLGLETEVS